jgi:plasmid stability protein
MATLQVRDVPDDVAAIIAERARATHRSVSAYLRDLVVADAKAELQRRAIAAWDVELDVAQEQLGLPPNGGTSGTGVIREVRDDNHA